MCLFIVGIPMLILELTLGQKMQSGSAGSLRGIIPRLAGAGWAASFAGFVSSLVYNILIGLSLVYLVNAGSEPWAESTYERPAPCKVTGSIKPPASEIYFFMNVSKLYNEDDCKPWEYGDEGRFAGDLYIATVIVWVICFLSVVKGAKSIQFVSIVTVITPYIFLFVMMGKFIGLNNEVDGNGMAFYMGSEKIKIPVDNDTNIVFEEYDPSEQIDTLFQDAYNQVFFSLGTCVGIWYAYSSYNKIKKPVIMDACIIAFMDFIFAFLAGFITWGVIGYLYKKDNLAYMQNNSIGLALIAFPEAASISGNGGWFGLFCFFLFIAGIDSGFCYVESVVTNLVDEFKLNRQVAAASVCLAGIALSALFTSNWGWIMFDLVDHYIASYIIMGVGLMQCISVGWLFEYETTAQQSPSHRKSMKLLASIYWIATITICFYANFGFVDNKEIGLLLIMLFTFIAFGVSKYTAGMPFNSWYHEIVLCGVDKLSMSITSLSVEGQPEARKLWMPIFETYFGLTIKFINPACLMWMILENVAADLDSPYAGQPAEMQVFSSIALFIAIMIIFAPMFLCTYPQRFTYNVNLEFNADNVYEAKLRMARMFKA